MRIARIASLLVAAVVCLSGVARADEVPPGLTRPNEVVPDPFPAPPPPAEGDKDGTTATAIALSATIGGYVIAGLGAGAQNHAVGEVGGLLLVVGPSFGHFYAGESGHALGMSLARTGAIVVVAVGVIASLNSVECAAPGPGEEGGCPQPENHGEAMIAGGAIAFAALTAYDVWDAHRAAARTNARNAQTRERPSAMVVPMGAGLALAGRF